MDDNYKGTTEQFVLHFNEQFGKLEEISDPSEHFPPQIKLHLVQNAVSPIDDDTIFTKTTIVPCYLSDDC